MKSISLTTAVLLAGVSCGSLLRADDNPAPAAQAIPDTSIEVMQMVLTREVNDRQPGAEVTAPKVGDVVVGFTQIRSGVGDVAIIHRWMHNGTVASDVPLTLKGSPWRTWSRKTLGEAGPWTWQVLNPKGDVLKEKTFTVSQ